MSTIPPESITRKALQAWLLNFHEASKSLDVERFSDFFTTDAQVRYANNPVARGQDDIKRDFGGAFSALDFMQHDIVYFDLVAGPESKLYQAVNIKYVVKGDDLEKDVIEIPACMTGWLEVEEGAVKLKKCEIYLDASRVFGRMAEKGLLG